MMPLTTYKYVAFGVQKGVYAEGINHDFITVNWHIVNDNVLSVDSVSMPNRNNPSWLWYRMNVKMTIRIGSTEYDLFNTHYTNVTNSSSFSYLGILCDDFANRSLPKSVTINTETTSFDLGFGGTITPVFAYSDGGGYSVQDFSWLQKVSGDNISPIPVNLKYRPGKRRISGRYMSINRSTGKAVTKNGKQLLSQDGGKAVSKTDMSTYADASHGTWRRQHKQ
jgi:hypothetical protein